MMYDLRVVDDDHDEISVMRGDQQIRGWSYRDETERRIKMLAAREYCEGWYQAILELGPIAYVQPIRDSRSEDQCPSPSTKRQR